MAAAFIENLSGLFNWLVGLGFWPFIGVTMGAIFSALAVPWWGHWLTESREQKKRIGEYRIELYIDIIAVISKFEEYRASRGRDMVFMSLEDQSQEIRITHSVRLIAGDPVIHAYLDFRTAVHHYLDRNLDSVTDVVADKIDEKRDRLIAEMRRDLDALISRPLPPLNQLTQAVVKLVPSQVRTTDGLGRIKNHASFGIR